MTQDNIISSISIEDYLDYEEPSNENLGDKIKNKSDKDNLRSYLDNFLHNFFKSLDNNNEPVDLFEKFMDEFERPLILKTLDFCKGNQIKASKVLGINRNTLRSKIKKLNIPSKYGKK